jgi:hypothetical protein
MVDDYRLNRENEVQLAEGRFRQDEDYRLTTFKRWLQTFEWDSVRDRVQRDLDARHGGPADGDRAVDRRAQSWEAEWAARSTEPQPDPLRQARAAVVALPAQRADDPDPDAVDRAAQLARWHADNEHRPDTDGFAHDRSA